MLNGKKTTVILGGAVLAFASIGAASAQTYYGSQLMTPEERAEQAAKMRSLPPGERESYRAERHEEMKNRAESMGLSLPDEPPAYGRGYGLRGPGYGYGYGYGHRGPGYGYGRRGPGYGYGLGGPGYGYGRRGPGYGYGRRGPGYGYGGGPGYRGSDYWGPGYGGWGGRGPYGPGYGDWGFPAW
jgi:hypothetical protein